MFKALSPLLLLEGTVQLAEQANLEDMMIQCRVLTFKYIPSRTKMYSGFSRVFRPGNLADWR